MAAVTVAALLTALSAVVVALLRRTRALTGEVAALCARLEELSTRLEAAERDLARRGAGDDEGDEPADARERELH